MHRTFQEFKAEFGFYNINTFSVKKNIFGDYHFIISTDVTS